MCDLYGSGFECEIFMEVALSVRSLWKWLCVCDLCGSGFVCVIFMEVALCV